MEESVRDLFFRENPGLSEEDIRMMNPLALAFLGDGVFELFVRSTLMGRKGAGELHRRSASLVSARAQRAAAQVILPHLTSEEEGVFRRGRNAHSPTKAKNATVGEYRIATGLEALFGWLFLKGELERLSQLFHLIMEDSYVG